MLLFLLLCHRLRRHQVKIGEVSCNPDTCCKQTQVDQKIPERESTYKSEIKIHSDKIKAFDKRHKTYKYYTRENDYNCKLCQSSWHAYPLRRKCRLTAEFSAKSENPPPQYSLDLSGAPGILGAPGQQSPLPSNHIIALIVTMRLVNVRPVAFIIF